MTSYFKLRVMKGGAVHLFGIGMGLKALEKAGALNMICCLEAIVGLDGRRLVREENGSNNMLTFG
jgi:hypothetical protein